jgi:thiol-disulfide isomerase/thioredoxin
MTEQSSIKKYVTLYYADWCGHCKTLKPEWFKFKAAYNKAKQEIKDKYKTELILNEYENDANPEKSAAEGVDGFPTIKIKYNDKTDDYIGARTAMGLFKKLLPQATDSEIVSWLEKADPSAGPLYGEVSLEKVGNSMQNIPVLQLGGSKGIRYYGQNAYDPKMLFANSYRKLMKYKKKCQSRNLI